MSQHSEPWRVERRQNSDYCEYGTILDANGGEVTGASLHGEGCVACGCNADIDDESLERIVACVNACRGIPTHVLENTQGTFGADGMKPEDWLLNPVTRDGEGYLLASPAGGVMRLTSAQRETIGKALRSVSP